jgi:hypothetical protein
MCVFVCVSVSVSVSMCVCVCVCVYACVCVCGGVVACAYCGFFVYVGVLVSMYVRVCVCVSFLPVCETECVWLFVRVHMSVLGMGAHVLSLPVWSSLVAYWTVLLCCICCALRGRALLTVRVA